MNRIIAIVVALGLLVAGLILFVLNDRGHPDTNESASVRLAWLPGPTFAGDYMAASQGYWESEGLDVTLNPGGFEHDAIKLVASGADTFGVSSGPQLIQARAKGVPIVAIGATIPQSPIGWVSMEGSGIKQPQDFIGKKVGAQFGTHTEITFEALMEKLGISLDDVERVAIGFDPRPFISGSVDVLPVYIIDQPIDLRAHGIALNIIDPREYGVAFAYGNVYFTTEETLQERPEVVRRFLRGAYRGWIEAEKDRVAAVTAIRSAAPDLDENTLREKLDMTFSFITDGTVQYKGVYPTGTEGWKHNLDLLRTYGEVSEQVDIQTVFSNTFLEDITD